MGQTPLKMMMEGGIVQSPLGSRSTLCPSPPRSAKTSTYRNTAYSTSGQLQTKKTATSILLKKMRAAARKSNPRAGRWYFHSWRQPAQAPRPAHTEIFQPVVQPARPPLPEFENLRSQPVTAPVRRPWHLIARVLQAEFREHSFQLLAAGDHIALRRRGCT